MGKFKQTLVKEVKAEQVQKKEQERLHEKHHIQDMNVQIVERDNMIKFLIRNVVRFVWLISTMILLVFAVIGILTIVYPNIRAEFLFVFEQIILEIKQMLPV